MTTARRSLIGFFCVVLVLLFIQAPAGAATKTIGDIVYADYATGDLYLIPVDGSPTRRLTSTGDTADPSFSPDGKTIAYDHDGDIWLLRPGVNKNRLTHNGLSTDPAWSPDGKTIAYTQAVAGGLSDIFLIPAAGGKAHRLSHAAGLGCSASQPTWQTNGTQLAYVRSGACAQGIVLQRLGAAGHLIITDVSARQPAFSADGKHLYYIARCPPGTCSTNRVTWKADPNGANTHLVVSSADCNDGDFCIQAMVRSPIFGWIEDVNYSPDDGVTTYTCFNGRYEDPIGNIFDTAPSACLWAYAESFDVRLA